MQNATSPGLMSLAGLTALVTSLSASPIQEAGEIQAAELERRVSWPLETGPDGREHAVFVADPEHDRAILYAGSGYAPYGSPLADAWAFDFQRETWSELDVTGDVPPAAGSRRAVAIEGGALLFGSYLAGFVADDALLLASFEGEELRFERIEQVSPPPARMLHAFACDPEGETMVVFGGAAQNSMLGDTWIGKREGDSVSWERLDDEGPGLRFGFAYGYDPEARRLVVLGGQMPGEPGGDPLAFGRDLWALDFESEAPSWTLLAELDADVFPGRRNPAFHLDPVTGDLFVWGGTFDQRNVVPGFHVIATREEGAPLRSFGESDVIESRASSFGVLDLEGGRAYLGFGNTGAGPFVDLACLRLRRPLDPALAKLRAQAETLAGMVQTDAARALLDAVPLLPTARPTSVFSRPGGGYLSEAFSRAEYDALDEAERAELRELAVDTERYYETFYGTPLASVHAFDIVAGHGFDSFAGKRICDFGFGSVGQLRLLAANGAKVVGAEVMPLLRAIYSAPDAQGPFGPAGGEVSMVFDHWPAGEAAVEAVGFSLDLFISKNTIKRGFIAPPVEVPAHRSLDLGVPNEVFLEELFAALAPGGFALFYNLGGAPAAEGMPYNPSTDIASPWSREEYESFGFEVVAIDVDDSAAARDWGRALGWADPPGSMDLENGLFGNYTLLKKP